MDEADHHDATGLLMALASAYDSGDVSGFVVFWWGGEMTQECSTQSRR